MEKATLSVLLALVFGLVIFTGCVSPQKSFDDFNPASLKSADEVAIGQIMVLREKFWIDKNLEGMLSTYAENAKIMVGGGKPEIISKHEFAERHRGSYGEKGRDYEYIFRGYPEIKILGPSEAEVKVTTRIKLNSGKEFPVNNKCKFTKIKDKWLVEEYTYTW